jgi:hypothetical protein
MTTTPLKRDVMSSEHQPVSGLVFTLRILYLVLALLFVGTIVLQVFFAGATLLVEARYLIDHRALGEAMWPLPVLMIVLSLTARLQKRFVLLSVLLLVLYVMQYAVIHVFPTLGMPIVFRALHAVNALLMFWVALHLARSTWRVLRPEAQTD